MLSRTYTFLSFLLTLLMAASFWIPNAGRAEAEMRCVGTSLVSAPCAHAELPVAGLNEKHVYGKLMFCCRSMQDGCALARRGLKRPTVQASPSAFLSGRCFVTIRVTSAPPALAAPRTRWFLTAAPVLAPLVTAHLAPLPVPASPRTFWTYSPVLSPHAAPRLHGLRAPPLA